VILLASLTLYHHYQVNCAVIFADMFIDIMKLPAPSIRGYVIDATSASPSFLFITFNFVSTIDKIIFCHSDIGSDVTQTETEIYGLSVSFPL
jgi:hypothetical protein